MEVIGVIGVIAVFILGLVVGFVLRHLADRSINFERQLLQSQLRDLQQAQQNSESEKNRVLQDLQQAQQNSESEKNRVLQQELGRVYEQLSRLDTETKRLNDTLSNDRLRGKWGETVAHSVLIKVGFVEGMHYIQQGTMVTITDKNSHPDYTFLLPNDQKIHMDCKFPFANYKAFVMADNPTKREDILKIFEKDVKTRIDETAKYIGEDTLNCVLMFIPNESLFHFVSESEAIQERAYTQRVILCSPQSLILMLELLQRAQQVINLERSSVQARSALLELVRLTEGFNEDINVAKKQIVAASTALNQLETKQVAKLNKSARSLMALLDSNAPLEPPAVNQQLLLLDE